MHASDSSWTPMTCLPKQTLTQAGLINLDTTDNEVQLIARNAIELRSLSPKPLSRPLSSGPTAVNASTWVDRNVNLTVTLTSHRIVFQETETNIPMMNGKEQKTPRTHFLHHCAIRHTSVKATGGNWTTNRSFKIFLETLTHGDFHFIFRNGQKDRDAFLDNLQKGLKRRQWEETYRLSANDGGIAGAGIGRSDNGTNSRVGVEAILERNRNRHDRAAKLTQHAFGKGTKKQSKDARAEEVEVLFREAKELTAIIHKYVVTLEKNQNSAQEGKEDTTELTSMLQGMGMITALTKDSTSSSSFHELLARQICDFLSTNPNFITVKGGSGIMTLTDVYCLYNRARGANMISPEDLIDALKKMEGLGLGMKLREFDGSGVMVLQECNFDDSVMAKKLIDYMEHCEGGGSGNGGTLSGVMDYIMGVGNANANDEVEVGLGVDGREKRSTHAGLTPLEAARVLKISPLLANEQLLSAERNGYLCRDVTLEGTRFYRNLFVTDF